MTHTPLDLGTALQILMEGDGCWPDLAGSACIKDPSNKLVAVAALPHGMVGGRPSVTLRIETPEGETILAETSMRLFCAAGRAFAARYADEIGWTF